MNFAMSRNHPANRKQVVQDNLHKNNLILCPSDTITLPAYFQKELKNYAESVKLQKAKEKAKLSKQMHKEISMYSQKQNLHRPIITEYNNSLHSLTSDDISQLTTSKSVCSLVENHNEHSENILPVISNLSPKKANTLVDKANVIHSMKKSIKPETKTKFKLDLVPKKSARIIQLKDSEHNYREFLCDSITKRLSRTYNTSKSKFMGQNETSQTLEVSRKMTIEQEVKPVKSPRGSGIWKKAKVKLILTKENKNNEKVTEFFKNNPVTFSSHYSPEYIEKEFEYLKSIIRGQRSVKNITPSDLINAFKKEHKKIVNQTQEKSLIKKSSTVNLEYLYFFSIGTT